MPKEFVRSVCDTHCLQICGILALVEDGRVVGVKPADFPDKRFCQICIKGRSLPQRIYSPDRMRYPAKRVEKNGKSFLERISWSEAIDIVARKFIEIGRNYGTKSLALIKGAGSLGLLSSAPQRLWNLFGGTLVFGGIDSAGPQALEDTLGVGWWTGPGREKEFGGSNEILDCLNSKMVIIWGANPSETDPRHWRFIISAQKRGTRVVVIDPRKTPSASKANWWISINPGTDAALALGAVRVIIERNLVNDVFVRSHTVGPFLVRSDNQLFLRERDVERQGSKRIMVWDTESEEAKADVDCKDSALTGSYIVRGIECKPSFQLLKDRALQFSPERVESITGVDRKEVVELGLSYAKNGPSAIYLMMGLDRWYYANITYRSIITLAAITGQIGVSGAGFYLSGGPQLDLSRDSWLRPNGSECNTLNPASLYDKSTYSQIKALWLCAANIFRYPDENKFRDFLSELEFIVVQDQLRTPAVEFADVILPACTCLERMDVHAGPFPFIQFHKKAIEPLYESKSDFEITSQLAQRLGFGQYFDRNPEAYVKLMLDGTGIPFRKLQKDGIAQIELSERPFVAFKDRNFLTSSGRVEFYIEGDVNTGHQLPDYFESREGPNGNHKQEKYPLVFLQCHSQLQCHTSWAKIPLLRKVDPEPILEMNPMDAKRRRIQNGDTVIVFNGRGRAKLKARIEKGMRSGVVNVDHGWWPDQFQEGSYQCLTHHRTNPSLRRLNFAYYDCLVEVEKSSRL